MNKVVIYTSVTGNYDCLKEPLVIDPRCDYICFTNNLPAKKETVWQYKKIPSVSDNLAILSRYPKMHPHVLLNNYNYSVYMDANIQIVDYDFYNRVFEKISTGINLSGIKHPYRDCPYDEGYAIFSYSLDSLCNIIRTLKFLKKQGFPKHHGMFEANVIFRNHRCEQIQKQCEEWWSLINHYSKRDQLTYSYTLWKAGIPFDYLIPETESARDYKGFSFTPHIRKKNIFGKKLKKIGKFTFNQIINF